MKRSVLMLVTLAAACSVAVAQTKPEPEKAAPPPTAAAPAANTVVTEADFDFPVEKLWWVFSTNDGFRYLGVAKAEIDFRVGGKMRSHYDPQGTIGDEGTIENTILAIDPMRVLAWHITKPPKGFPFMNTYKDVSSVATFTDLGNGRSRLRLTQAGYGTDEESQKMRAFFDQGNAYVLQKLGAKLSGKKGQDAGAPAGPAKTSTDPLAPIVVETMVAAMPADVWKCWTTSEGFKSFMGVENKIDLRIGGPFEVYFSMDPPAGQRGSEGCTILSYEPNSMLSFSWNAPPKFAHARSEHTWVVVNIQPAGAHGSKVVLKHLGFTEKVASEAAHAEEWKQVREYFNNAWPRVLGALKDKYEPK